MLRFGILGCGGAGRSHARLIASLGGGIELAGCCDVRAEAAEACRREFGGRAAFASIDDFLRAGPYDGVVVATWPAQHREHVVACIEAGVPHVLCEKALTASGADAVAILEAASRRGATVMEAVMVRHHPALRRMLERAWSGDIGPVVAIRGAFCFRAEIGEEDFEDSPERRNWRLRPEAGGGVSHDFLAYVVNGVTAAARALPVRAVASAEVHPHYGVVTRLTGIVEFEGGRRAVVESALDHHFDAGLRISGRRGHLRIPSAWFIPLETRIEHVRTRQWGHPVSTPEEFAAADAYALQLRQWVNVIRGAEPPLVPLIESVVAAHVTDTLLAAARQGGSSPAQIPDAVREAARAWVR